MKRSDGFSTLEVIVTLLLSALVFTLSFPSFRLLAQRFRQIRIEERLHHRLEAAKGAIVNALLEARSLYGLPTVAVSATPSHVLSGRTHQLIVLAFEDLHPLDVAESSHRSIDTVDLQFIPGAHTRSSPRNMWLGLTVDGPYLFSGLRTAPTFRAVERPGFPMPDGAAPILTLFPLRDYFTLSLDSSGTLRRRSLLTGENQPVVYGLSEFEIVERSSPGARLLEIILGAQEGSERRHLAFAFALPTGGPLHHLNLIR